MSKLIAFNFITLNGFYKGNNEDISWHRHGEEESKYSEDMLKMDNILLLGRKTYDQMASFWPTSTARDMMPTVAAGMNNAEKIVFSRNPNLPISWENTKLISENIVEKIKALKSSSKKDMAILGSGSIINLFTVNRLIDEYQIMIDPVALGSGTQLLYGIDQTLNLKLTQHRVFKSGVILLYYSCE
jgi:dihydrofolate reductase